MSDEDASRPVVPRDAATVMLVRGGTDDLEVFVQQRVDQMAFAPGMTVFPGGSVDSRDADAAVAWAGPTPAWWAELFGCDESLARALVCAAVRETFEEAGVLLVGPDPDRVVTGTEAYAEARRALVADQLSLAEFLADAGLVLRADLLRGWSNWVTPEDNPRRYDTRFFLAALPAGQTADGETTEAVHIRWQRPAEILEDWQAGRRRLLPPTWKSLSELAEHPHAVAALAAHRQVEKIVPKVVRCGDRIRLIRPEEPGYNAAHTHLDP